MWSNILDRISFWSLFLVVVLLPLFFFPFLDIPIEIGKGFLLIIGLAVSVIAYLGARFADGKLVIAKSPIFLGGLGVVVATFLSAFFSSSVKLALFGVMLDTGTALFILALFLLMFMSAVLLKDHNKAKQVIFGSLISFTLVFLFQILRFLAPEFFSWGALGSKTENIFGSWNSLGILAGLSLLASVFVIEFFNLKKKGKIIMILISLLSLFFVMAVNFPLSWKVIGVFAMLMFVYKVSIHSKKDHDSNKFQFPSFAFGVVMISLLFFMSGQFIGVALPRALNITSIEVGPSFESTLSVGKASLAKDPIFGIGPNKFSEIWSLYKPETINSTQFWDTVFGVGTGLVPTLALTTGILGILAWLAFIIMLLYFSVKILFSENKEGARWEIPFFIFCALFLLTFSVLYSVSNAVFLLVFAYIGIAIGMAYHYNKEKGEIEVSFLGDPRKSFFAILTLILIMVFAAGATFKYVEKFASVSYFRNALSANELPKAESAIAQAVSLYPNDLYLRTFAQVQLLKLNSIVAKGDKMTEQDQADILDSFRRAQAAAQTAIEYDPNNYINYRALATVYSNVAPLGVEGAVAGATESLDKAIAINPLNPGLHLAKSQVYLTANQLKDAKVSATKALELKADYIDALIFLSQISKREGSNTEALKYAEQALSLSPKNQDLIDYVASFKTNRTTVEETPDSKDEE